MACGDAVAMPLAAEGGARGFLQRIESLGPEGRLRSGDDFARRLGLR